MKKQELIEKSEHGDLMLPAKIYHPRLDQFNTTLPVHWHRHMEISYIRKGKAVYQINFQEYQVEAGDVIMMAPEQLHSGQAIAGFDSENITIVFDLPMLVSSQFDRCTANYIFPILNGDINLPSHMANARKHVPGIVQCIKAIAKVFEQKEDGYELLIKSKLFELLFYLYSSTSMADTKKNLSESDSKKIKEILTYIHENYTKELYISDIAYAVSYNESYLERYFKKITQMTCFDYINQLRIHKAAELLTETQHPVTEIAFQVGFFNLSYFAKKFRQVYGISPSDYRKKDMHSSGTGHPNDTTPFR